MNSLSNYQPKEQGFYNLAPIKPEIDWSEFFSSRSIHLGMEIPEQKPVIVDHEGTPIGSLGELMLLTGKPKVGKSRLTNVFLSTALSQDPYCNLIGKSHGEKNKVVVMDTEQNSYYNYEAFIRVREMAKMDDSDIRLEYYSLSKDMPDIRLKAIEKYLEMHSDTLVLLVDGVADLVLDINNVSESAHIATTLNALAEQYQVLIITVLHENKGDGNAKGHLGSYITQKCCCHISLDKPDIESETRNVIFKMSRGKLPKSFAFTINENGIPELAKYEGSKGGGFTSYSLDIVVHKEMISEIFEGKEDCTGSELRELIALKLDKLSKPHGMNLAKTFVTRWKVENWIIDNGEKANKLRYYKN